MKCVVRRGVGMKYGGVFVKGRVSEKGIIVG